MFGSRARGDAAPGSDLDVFIELETCTPGLRRRISEIAWEVGFEMDRVISTVVATREELERGAMGANPLVLNVEREGVRLYDQNTNGSLEVGISAIDSESVGN